MLCERKIARKIANRVNDIIDGVYDNRQDKSMKYRYINITVKIRTSGIRILYSVYVNIHIDHTKLFFYLHAYVEEN